MSVPIKFVAGLCVWFASCLSLLLVHLFALAVSACPYCLSVLLVHLLCCSLASIPHASSRCTLVNHPCYPPRRLLTLTLSHKRSLPLAHKTRVLATLASLLHTLLVSASLPPHTLDLPPSTACVCLPPSTHTLPVFQICCAREGGVSSIPYLQQTRKRRRRRRRRRGKAG